MDTVGEYCLMLIRLRTTQKDTSAENYQLIPPTPQTIELIG